MTKVAIVLTPGFADWEFGLLTGPGQHYYGLELGYFAPEVGALQSISGLTVVVDHALDSLVAWQPDVVAIIGGTIWETESAPDFSAALRTLYDQGSCLGGICAGTTVLARAGLLDQVKHTSNRLALLTDQADTYTGHALYQDQPQAVSDGRIVTASGFAPASFALEMLAAAGVPAEAVQGLRDMLAAEHTQ